MDAPIQGDARLLYGAAVQLVTAPGNHWAESSGDKIWDESWRTVDLSSIFFRSFFLNTSWFVFEALIFVVFLLDLPFVSFLFQTQGWSLVLSVQVHLDSGPNPSLINLTKSTKTVPHKASKFGLHSRESDPFQCFITARPDMILL